MLLGNDSTPCEFSCEDQIFLTESNVLCDGEVMRLQAESLDAFRVPGRQSHQPALPASGKCCGLFVNGIGVVTTGLVKLRVDADCVQPFGPLRALCRQQVHLCRLDDVIGKIWILSVKSLAANYYELLLAGDAADGKQDVIKLLLLHGVSSPLLATAVPRKA